VPPAHGQLAGRFRGNAGGTADLDLAIWACLANARLDQQRASQQREQDLAA
jgi:hypothetical protein